MACGLPLICADNRGTRDYAANGENALVCKYDSRDDFSEAIQSMLADPYMREHMGNFNCEKAKKFDMDFVIVEMQKIYRETLGQQKT